MFINKISASKLDKYDLCARAYRLRYVDGISEDFSGKSDTDALQFGSFIHEIFEEGWQKTSLQELLSIAKECRPNYKFKSRDGDMVKALRNFLKFNAKLWDTLGVEQKFSIDIEGHDFSINGFIDRVVRGADGGILIIDYKTGRTVKTKQQLYKDTQMMIYTFAASMLYDVPIEKITAAHYYPIQDKFVSVQLNPKAVKAFVYDYIRNKIWEIRKKKYEDFPPTKNRFCDWCGYKCICPIFGVDESLLAVAEKLSRSKKFSV